MSNGTILSLIKELTPDNLADEIVSKWATLKQARTSWEAEMIEIRAFAFATSTRTTEAGQSNFKNSTTIPKLSQIAINLKANYSAHLWGNPRWAQFEAGDSAAASMNAKRNVEAYARTKIKRKDYEGVMDSCLDDWLYTGMCFAQQRYVTEMGVDSQGNPNILYQGTVLERIPVADLVFDVTAASFEKAHKVIRKIYTLGDIAEFVEDPAYTEFTPELLENMRTTRMNVRQYQGESIEGINWKSEALTRDGFSNLLDYYNGDNVEILEFYGSIYSLETGEFLKNHKIIVIDKTQVISKEPITTTNGSQNIYYSTPERRPDNLAGISPLARIVGMQYKLDKLENQKADIFDQIANPITVEKGDVEFFGTRGAPGGRYVSDEAGDVQHLVPDSTVLNADFQINNLLAIMEEMAGSPKSASGQRTPGEKTKFEVQILDNGGNRIFRERTKLFEKDFIERILDDMIDLAKTNLGESDLVSTEGVNFNTQEFLSITADDLAISGKLRARGSQLFAEKANALQNIVQLIGSPAATLINPHVSRIKLAEALEELADFKEFGIIVPNIGIQEDQASQRMANASADNTSTVDVVAATDDVEELPDGGEDQ